MTLRTDLRSRSMLARMVSAHQGRPVLITPEALHVVAEQLRLVATEQEAPRRFGLSAIARMFQGNRDHVAMDQEDEAVEPLTPAERFAMLGASLRPDLGGLNPARISGEGWGFVIVDGVAVIAMHGAIPEHGGMYCGAGWHGYDTIAESVRAASADDRAKAILLWQKSPGGVVCGGLDVAAQAITDAGKPLHVYADQSCSAAYWLASGATAIHANRYAMIGSIGAAILHEDFSRAIEAHGITISLIKFGDRKMAGNPWTALDDATRARLQAEVDQIGRDFVARVVAGRPSLSEEAVIGTQAGVFMGSHDEAARSALALGLIDTLQPDVITALDHVISTLSAPAAGSAAIPESPAPTLQPEAEMALNTSKWAAIDASDASPEEKLTKIRAIMDEDNEANAEGEDGAPAEDDVEDDIEDAAEGEQEPEANAETGPMATAKAILALPEAKGREALAQHLAFEPGMTVAKAQATLNAAPKASALKPVNPQLGAGPAASAAPADKGLALVASAMAKLGRPLKAPGA